MKNNCDICNKKLAIPYLESIARCYFCDIFDLFDEYMEIPESKTLKNIHSYIDYKQEGILIDYLGKKGKYEEFSSVHIEPTSFTLNLSTNFLNYGETSIKVLYLHASNTIDIDKFAYVGAHFLDNSNRDKNLFNPCKWVDEWKEIFGDSIKHKMVYDVIGELISLKYIQEQLLV